METNSVRIESISGIVQYNDVLHFATLWEEEKESLVVMDVPPLHRPEPNDISSAYYALRNYFEIPEDARILIQGIRSKLGPRSVILLINVDVSPREI